MQDRFRKLQSEQLRDSHVALVFVDPQQGQHRALVMKHMTVKELREELMARFADENAKRSDYALYVDNQALPLSLRVGELHQDATVVFRKAEKQQARDALGFLEPNSGQRFPINVLPAKIGRRSSSGMVDIDLSDLPEAKSVSRLHAEVVLTGETYYIRNLSESSPLLVNGTPLTVQSAKALSDGTHITLGKAHLVFYHQRSEA